MKYTLKTFEQKLNEMFPNNHVKVLEYSGTFKPIKYQCLDCGRIIEKSRANHLYENKTLCSKCYSSKDSKIREWIKNFIKNSNQFDYAELWSGVTTIKLKLICHKCNNVFEKIPSNMYQKDEDTICPYCGLNGSPIPQKIFWDKLTKQERADYKLLSYQTIGKKAIFEHKCGFIFEQKPVDFLKSKGCPNCFQTMSTGEKIIARFLINNNIKYEYEKHFSELSRMSYDFYLPDHNLLIEFQGEQHYHPIVCFGGEEAFKIQQEHDRIKKEFAESNNINLLYIPYYHKYKIDSYLKSLLGSTTSPSDVVSSETKQKAPNGDDIV